MSEWVSWAVAALVAADVILGVFVVYMVSGLPRALGRALHDELGEIRDDTRASGRDLREEVSAALRSTAETLARTLEGLGKAQHALLESMATQVRELGESSRDSLERVRSTLDMRVRELQEGNERKLDEMRRIVDEKLHETLEKRLGESFRIVGERLEAVHKGLGEMQTLAAGVGDLKRVLTNVKVRGTWAEVQLGAILEQVLVPGQYAKNVKVKQGS
ncbi:MAG TPA: DNA recombination protein RmuC, partial [Deltaproteobacteria bacterium]|nr:DNA recombination protein RmuC [Deltaproteobacteria bacterium]